MAGMDERVSIPIELGPNTIATQLQAIAAQLANLGKAGHDSGAKAAEGMGGLNDVLDKLHARLREGLGPLTLFEGILGPAAAAVGAIFLVGEGLKKLAEAGIEAQKVQYDLQAAIKITGVNYSLAAEGVETYVSAVEKSSRFGDSEIRSALEQMVTLTGNLTTSEELLGVTADFAAARHMDLGQAANIVARALEGNLTILRRSGVILDTYTQTVFGYANETQRAALLQDILNSKFGGRAADDIATTAGAIAKFKSELTDLKEKIGTDVLTVLVDFKSALHDIGAGAAQTITALSGLHLSDDQRTDLEKLSVAAENARILRLRQDSGHAASPEATRGLAAMSQDLTLGGVQAEHDAAAAAAKALADAAAAALALKTAVDAGTMSGAAAALQFKTLELIIAGINDKGGAGIAAMADDIIKMGRHAEETGTQLGAVFDAQYKIAVQIKADQNTQQDAAVQAFHNNELLLDQQTKFADLAEQNAEKVRAFYFALEEGAKGAIAELAKLGQAGLPAAADVALRLAQQRAFVGPLSPEEIAQAKKLQEDANKAGVDTAKQEAQVLTAAWKKIAADYQRDFIEPLGNAFSDLITNGGANIGQILAQGFVTGMQAKSKDLATILTQAISGGTITKDAQGHYFYGGVDRGTGDVGAQAAQAAQRQGSPLATAANIGLQGAGAFMSSYNQKGQTDLDVVASATVGFVATIAATASAMGALYTGLASIGPVGWIAAAVVAVAQVAGHLLQPSPSQDYQYIMALHTNAQGVASGTGNENVDANTLRQYLDTFTQTVDTFYNGYINILLKFPNEILPKISASFQPIYGAFENGADLGLARSAKFAEELQAYLKTGLPHDIGDAFSSFLGSGLETMGMSAARFSEIWTELSNVDPAKALQAMSDLVDAMVGFNTTLAAFNTPVFEDANHLHPLGGLMQQVQNSAALTFAQQLEVSDKALVQVGNSLGDIIGPDQMTQAKSLADQMTQRYEKEKQYLQDITTQIETITHSFEQQMQGYTLAGMQTPGGTPDYQAQNVYLQAQTQLLMNQLHNATTPEQITSIYNQIAANIDKIYQNGSQLGPAAEAAYRHWAETNLATAEQAAIARQNTLAAQVDAANQAFLDAIQGFITAFENATNTLTGGVQTGPGSISYQQSHPNYVPLPGTPAYIAAHPTAPPAATTDPVPDAQGHCPTGWVVSADGKACNRDHSANRGADTRTTTGRTGFTTFGASVVVADPNPTIITAQSNQSAQVVAILSAIQAILADGQNLRLQIVDDSGNDITPPSSAPGFRARASASR